MPESILGPHPEEFFGAVGRVVCVAAVLEDKVTTLRHTLVGARQDRYTHQPISEQMRQARQVAAECDDSMRIAAFLSEAQSSFDRRNGLVHSQWPVQTDGSLFGHRPDRDKSCSSERDGHH